MHSFRQLTQGSFNEESSNFPISYQKSDKLTLEGSSSSSTTELRKQLPYQHINSYLKGQQSQQYSHRKQLTSDLITYQYYRYSISDLDQQDLDDKEQQNLKKIKSKTPEQHEKLFKESLIEYFVEKYQNIKPLPTINLKQQCFVQIETLKFIFYQRKKNSQNYSILFNLNEFIHSPSICFRVTMEGLKQIIFVLKNAIINFFKAFKNLEQPGSKFEKIYNLQYQAKFKKINLKDKQKQFSINQKCEYQDLLKKQKNICLKQIQKKISSKVVNLRQFMIQRFIDNLIYRLFPHLFKIRMKNSDRNSQNETLQQGKLINSFTSLQYLQQEALKFCLEQIQDIQNRSRHNEYAQLEYSSQIEVLILQLVQQYGKQLIKDKNPNQIQLFNDYFCQKQIIHTQILFNISMLCYQFNYNEQFGIMYHSGLKNQNKNYSFLQHKISVFIKALREPAYLKRIYVQSTVSFRQLNQINKDLNFNIFSLYYNFLNKQQLDLKVKHFVHLAQFYHQIISDLSSSQNIILSNCFNCSRFLLLNLISHFSLIQYKRIQKQILNSHKEFYYNAFIIELNNHIKWRDIEQKTKQALSLSQGKISSYIVQIRNGPSQEMSLNAKKLAKLFKQNNNLQKLFLFLNNKNRQLVYDFQLCKQIYSEIISLMIKQITNQAILQRGFAKIIKLHQPFCSTNKINQIKSLHRDVENSHQSQFKEIFDEYLTVFLEMVKIFSMILLIPYYSYETERNNYRKKVQSLIKKELIKSNSSKQKKRKKERLSVFVACDVLYIYDRHRFNGIYLKACQGESMNHVFSNYMQYVLEFLDYFQETDFIKKQNLIKNKYSQLPLPEIINERLIYTDILCKFSRNQWAEYFFLLYHTSQERLTAMHSINQRIKLENLQNNTKQKQLGNYNLIETSLSLKQQFSKKQKSAAKQHFNESTFENSLYSNGKDLKLYQQEEKHSKKQPELQSKPKSKQKLNLDGILLSIKNNQKLFLNLKVISQLRQFVGQIRRFYKEAQFLILQMTNQSTISFSRRQQNNGRRQQTIAFKKIKPLAVIPQKIEKQQESVKSRSVDKQSQFFPQVAKDFSLKKINFSRKMV